MSECAGYVGRVFGHKFRRFESERIPPSDLVGLKSILEDYPFSGYDVRTIAALTKIKSAIRCVRCGECLKSGE